MAILPIVLHPNPVLRKKARPVQKINASVKKLIEDMVETMYDAPGIGLAAPQVGVSKRIIVVDVRDGKTGLLKLINPEIVHAEGRITWTEGCLSIPGYVGDVDRFKKVKVTALDEDGRRVWIEAEDLLAVCLQHEIDHLDGVLYIDKARNVREVKDEDEGEAESAASGPAAGAEAAGTAAPAAPPAPEVQEP